MDFRAASLVQAASYLLPFLGNPDRRQMTSGVSLFIANLIPLAGIFLFGWLPGVILTMFWMESAVVGFYNVLRMLTASSFERSGEFNPAGILGGLFLSAFFTVHFGLFMLGHGVFLLVFMAMGVMAAPAEWGLSGQEVPLTSAAGILTSFFPLADPAAFLTSPGLGVAAIFISHGISFVLHFVRGREYIQAETANLMMRPYKRIIVMHVTIIAGAFLMFGAAQLGIAGAGFVACLVVLKLIVDLRAHYSEHQSASKAPA